jgi:putative oxidoreductase
MTDLHLLPERESDRAFPDLAIRLGVAVLYLVLGLGKFSSSPGSHWVVMFNQIHAGSWFRYGTGVVECVGALLVLIPRAAFFGLLVLSCTMLCASLIVAFVLHQLGEATFPGFLFLVLSAIAFARRLKRADRHR